MEEHRIGSMPIVDDDARPLGIFTRQDVIGRVVLPQRPLTAPMRDVMSAPAITLPADATAGDAALLMAQRGIRHVVVVDGAGRLAGVVSERDLFSLQRLSVRELASAIRRAADIPTLVQCAADVRALSHSLVAQGVAAGQLTRMISSLNDQLAVRILELTAPKHDLAGLTLCWLGMGSEGRGEQTIATDQDNGLIFVTNDEGITPDDVRERLLPFARAVNEAMDRCGYPLCKGGVMAMNPRWCASLDEWKAAFANWIDRGDPDSLLAANIFFDFRALWGEPRLADALRADIALHAEANARFLKQMSDNALRNRPPLNWRGELQGAEDDARRRGHRPQDERQRPVRRRGAHLLRWRPASPRPIPSSGLTAAGRARAASRPRRSARGATPSSTCSCCACASSIAALAQGAARRRRRQSQRRAARRCCRISTAAS